MQANNLKWAKEKQIKKMYPLWDTEIVREQVLEGVKEFISQKGNCSFAISISYDDNGYIIVKTSKNGYVIAKSKKPIGNSGIGIRW